ncbi:UBFD1 [Cervus elaphus hippelaphus]|uniref:UBFD1 n=1 Tax=Cervus elaphus hippelaphus TaxID=46360 RepID=A0A212CZF7_CEREH|nr:UBFD1 [Cervus elaphus hippelaphus]
MAAAGAPDGECGGGGGRPGRAGMKRALLGDVARHWGWAVTLLGHIGPAAPAQSLVPGPARGERPPSKPLAGMEEPGMDTEAETVAAEAPARSSAARGSLQPAPAQPPGDPAAQASVSNGEDAGGGAGRELVDLKIIWNKTKHDVNTFPFEMIFFLNFLWVACLPPAMQKVMYKGLVPEDKTLREIKVTSGAKIMVVGSTINDVLAVNTPKDAAQQDAKAEENKKEPLCRQKQHRKVLDKGKPEDVMPSVKGAQERLPAVPLSGMYNKSGGKVRLTFKLEQDQLWIGTKERTEKLPMGSIKNVVSEPIEGHEDYHMMAFQLGPTEASYYWVYWVPTQYVDAIKDTVLGKWQYF